LPSVPRCELRLRAVHVRHRGPLDAAVDEMFRVVRRGGVVGFTEWTGEGVVGALWEPLSGFASAKMEQQETDDWGNEDHVRSRLSKHASLIDLRRQVLQGRFESVDRFCTDFWQNDPEIRALDVGARSRPAACPPIAAPSSHRRLEHGNGRSSGPRTELPAYRRTQTVGTDADARPRRAARERECPARNMT
jgi:hypothetical protein